VILAGVDGIGVLADDWCRIDDIGGIGVSDDADAAAQNCLNGKRDTRSMM